MSFAELMELLQYIQENNSWEKQGEINFEQGRARKIVKYIDFCVDTRTADVWHIKLRGGHNDIVFDDGTALMPKNLKEDIYKWLDEPDPALKKVRSK